jgi:hypothetical protein
MYAKVDPTSLSTVPQRHKDLKGIAERGIPSKFYPAVHKEGTKIGMFL